MRLIFHPQIGGSMYFTMPTSITGKSKSTNKILNRRDLIFLKVRPSLI